MIFDYLFPWRISPLIWVMWLAHAYLLIRIHESQYIEIPFLRGSHMEIVAIILSFITVFLVLQLIHILSQRSRLLLMILSSIYVFFYGVGAGYLFYSCYPFDFRVWVDNFSGSFSWEALGVMAQSLQYDPIIYALVIIIVFIVLEAKKRILSRVAHPKPIWPKVIGLGVIYAIFLGTLFPTSDVMTSFFQSAVRYFFHKSTYPVSCPTGQYPYVSKRFDRKFPINTNKNYPNVFIIVIESFSNKAIETKLLSGQFLMPVFHELSKKGLSVDYFYANSINTPKGHFAIMSSVYPSIGLKVFSDYPDIKIYSLPQILQDVGYETIFFQAHLNKKFDNTGYFVTHHGFQYHKTPAEFEKCEDIPYKWDWGYEDRVLYRAFFEFLDQEHLKNSTHPYFGMLATISTHVPCAVPEARRKVFKKPTSFVERYSNAIFLTDEALGDFFKELQKRPYLKDSIVVITGDHPYPFGDHVIKSSELGFYEESFRLPFLLVYPKKIPSMTIKNVVYSQVDIAPTVIDLAGIPLNKHHMQGQSILVPYQDRPAFLIQPYNGKHLAVVRFPLKYVFSVQKNQEILFNLLIDPKETKNVISDPIYQNQIKQCRKDLQGLYLNQVLIEQNQIWP